MFKKKKKKKKNDAATENRRQSTINRKALRLVVRLVVIYKDPILEHNMCVGWFPGDVCMQLFQCRGTQYIFVMYRMAKASTIWSSGARAVRFSLCLSLKQNYSVLYYATSNN